jgi:hypothetical protein
MLTNPLSVIWLRMQIEAPDAFARLQKILKGGTNAETGSF